MNYHTKKREVKRITKHKDKAKKKEDNPKSETSESESESVSTSTVTAVESPWDNHKPIETKTRDEEMEDYLQDLLL